MPDTDDFVDVIDLDGTTLVGYKISRDGQLRSYRARNNRYSVELTDKFKLLNPTTNNYGYKIASICQGGGVILQRQVHALVLMAFVGPPPTSDHQCRHLNGIRNDNRLENLCWGSALENRHDQYGHGTSVKGERVGTAKLTEDQVREIRRLANEGHRHCNLARQFNLKPCTIGQIVERRSWKHVE